MIGSKFAKLYSTFTNSLDDVFILSAVRTPVALFNGSLFGLTPSQVSAVTVKEGLERGRVSLEDIQDVFLGCSFQYEEIPAKFPRLVGLRSPKFTVSHTSGLNNIIQAVDFLLANKKETCAAVGMDVLSNQKYNISFMESFVNNISEKNTFPQESITAYNSQSYQNLFTAYNNKAFEDEMISTSFRNRGTIERLDVDDIINLMKKSDPDAKDESRNVAVLGDGASAIIIASGDYIKKNNLTPIAKFVSTAHTKTNSEDTLSEQIDVIQQSLKAANCNVEDISQWEIDDFVTNIGLGCIQKLNINNALVNKDGGTISLGNPVSMSGARAVCHLTHSLQYGKLGCAADCHFTGIVSATVIKKLDLVIQEKPKLTLYTKHPCPLCDELKAQLEPFSGRFDFQEVDVKAEENRKLRRLYRFEIPVLFLDGIFLCKNELDVEYFTRRLEKAEKLRNNTS